MQRGTTCMKKRLVCLLLAVLLLGAMPVSAVASSPTVMVVSARLSENELALIYWLQGASAGQELTCLVTDEEGATLQAMQFAAEENGLHTVTMSARKVNGYQLSLGGTDIGTYRTVNFADAYTASCLFVAEGQTVGSLKADLSALTDVTVMAGEEVLADEATVTAGHILQATYNGQSVTCPLVIPGDATMDGKVNATDALQILRYIVGKQPLEGVAFLAADFRQNGQVSAQSALMILQYIVGKINTL